MSLFSFYEFVFFPSISLTCGLGREVGARGERARGGERLICLARYCPQVKLIESKKTNYKASAEESASGISLICGLIQSTQSNQILENGNFRVTEK